MTQLVKVVSDSELKINGGRYGVIGDVAYPVIAIESDKRAIQGAIPVYVTTDFNRFKPSGATPMVVADIDVVGSNVDVIDRNATPVYVISGSLGLPAQPTGLTATQNGADVDLAWTDNATNNTGYYVYRSSDDVSYIKIDTIGDLETYIDTAPGGGMWWYKVSAYNAAGETLSNAALVVVVVYSFLDQFATNEAAPVASPRTAEPGPGTLTFVQNDGQFGIVGNELQFVPQTTPLYGDLGFYITAGFARAAGLAMKMIINLGATDQAISSIVTWQSAANLNPSNRVYEIQFSNGALAYNYQSGSANPGATWTYAASTDYKLAIVLRSLGAFSFHKAGGQWILDYIYDAGNQATLYPVFYNRLQTGSIDDLSVSQLPSPLDSDYGIATNRTVSPGDGATTTSEANAIVEVTITAATGVTQELDVRRTDDDNRWIVRMDQAGSTIKLIERNAAIETERASAAQTWTDATAYRIAVIMADNTIRTFVASVAKNTYTSATFNNTATGVKISHAASNLVTWPRVLSGTAANALEAV